ncbi:MAG: hypothetical protein J6T32_03405 [Paludibacteraceae bacterium]|nr:hypothetical protein [Paludibacteraceae bacterium]
MRSVFVPSADAPYASIGTPTDDTKTMKVFIPPKKTEKYLRMCKICCTFARFFEKNAFWGSCERLLKQTL